MPYQYIEFSGVPLPIYNPTQSHDAMGMASSLVPSLGGVWDMRGDGLGYPTSQIHSLTGTYLAAMPVMIDEVGNWLVTEQGFAIVEAAEPSTILRSQILALQKKVRSKAQLVRVRLDDGVRTWKTARFLSMRWQQRVEDRVLKAEITCEFETSMVNWHYMEPNVGGGSASAGVPLVFPIFNAEAEIADAALTVTATSGPITLVNVLGDGIDFSWVGTLAVDQVLTIDTGAMTIRVDGVDAYSGLTWGVGHTSVLWLPLPSGVSALSVTAVGGAADIEILYYPQVP